MEQLNLFDDNNSHKYYSQSETLLMSRDALLAWKQEIFNYQQTIKGQQAPTQMSLFELTPTHCNPENIDPFSLRLGSSQFYRGKEFGDETCLYFVIDNHLPILLYIGETINTPKQRWSNHDCQQYILNYIELHRKYDLEVQVLTGFWWDAPTNRRHRQKLEKELILKWRSPFNKQSWQLWGKPF